MNPSITPTSNTTDEAQRIAQLRAELHRHNRAYYVDNAPTITDQAFDQLMHELIRLEAAHPELYDASSPTQRVGSDISHEFEQYPHPTPMLSLGNTYSRADIDDFYRRVSDALEGEAFQICCELKFDGLSIALHYEAGRLVRALTRGDGIQGDDVTANVRTIQSIPLLLPLDQMPSDTIEVRGEVLMPWKSFDRLNLEREALEQPLFANPRNAASGTLKSKKSAVVAHRQLDAYLYYMLLPSDATSSTATHYEHLQQLRQLGFKVSEHIQLASTIDEVMAFIDHWQTARHALPYATDGIVLKVNSLEQQRRIGSTAKSPNWAIAYKFPAEQAITHLREVTFQVGRTGAITPVANMDPTLLAGTTIRRASLHNADIIRQLDLHLDDEVIIEKAGEIIPQIVGVHAHAFGTQPVQFITHCPACGAPLIRYPGEAAHYCTNLATCPPQIKGRIEHFISRDAMNIASIGPQKVDQLFSLHLITTPADLYQLTLPQLLQVEGTKQRSANNLLQGIEQSRQQPFHRLLFALGIRFVGKVVAKRLADQFHSMQALQQASYEQLCSAEGVGETIATSIRQFFSQEANLQLIEQLRQAGLSMEEAAPAAKQSDRLAGCTIVISGTFTHHSREAYKQLIEEHGGKVGSSLSRNTTYLLAGENMGPSKLQKATQLHIPILSEAEFIERISE